MRYVMNSRLGYFSKPKKWDEGGTFDLENFMKYCKNNYNNYVTDSL